MRGRRLVDKGNGFGQILLDLRILRLDVGAHLSVDRQIFTLPLQRFLFVHKLPEAFTGFCDVSLRLCNLTQQLLRLFHRGVKLGLIGEQTAQIPGIFNSDFFLSIVDFTSVFYCIIIFRFSYFFRSTK